MAQKPPPAATEPDVDSKSTDASGGTPIKRGGLPADRSRQAAAAKLAQVTSGLGAAWSTALQPSAGTDVFCKCGLQSERAEPTHLGPPAWGSKPYMGLHTDAPQVKKQLSEADAEGKWVQRPGPLIDRPTGSAPAHFGALGQVGSAPLRETPAWAAPAAAQPSASAQGGEDVVPELPTPAMVRQTSKERREASRAALAEQLERDRAERQAAREEAERRRAADSLDHRQQLEGLKAGPAGGASLGEEELELLAQAGAGGGSGRGTPPPSGGSLTGLPAGVALAGGLTPASITPARSSMSSGAVTPSGRSGGMSRQHSGPEQGHVGAEPRAAASPLPGSGGTSQSGGAAAAAGEAALENCGSGSSVLRSQTPSLPPSRSHSHQGLGQGNGAAADGGEGVHPSVTHSGGSGSSSMGVNRWVWEAAAGCPACRCSAGSRRSERASACCACPWRFTGRVLLHLGCPPAGSPPPLLHLLRAVIAALCSATHCSTLCGKRC